jgi:DNA ligase-1
MWDPLQTTGVTSKKVDLTKIPPENNKYPTDIMVLLDGLYTRTFSGHEAQFAIVSMLLAHPDHGDLILCIINKNLKTRITHKIINKAFPGLIADFSVSLGQDKTKSETHFQKDPTSWYVSRKFDGVRCIVRVDGANTACFSRTGNKFHSMQNLANLAAELFPPGTILDGEVCQVDENNIENFKNAVSQIRKKDLFTDFRFYVFDILTATEFDSGVSTRSFVERYKDLDAIKSNDNRIHIVEQSQYTPEKFATMNALVAKYAWEGLILRRDAPYKGMRSNDILKHKLFHTADYVVIGVDSSTMRNIDEKTGLEFEEAVLKSVIIHHKGEVVHVGSGFDLTQRRFYQKSPEAIIGRLIEVQYFEESTDANGKISLRFPTVKQIYTTKKRKI